MKTHILPQTSETFLWYNKKYDKSDCRLPSYNNDITRPQTISPLLYYISWLQSLHQAKMLYKTVNNHNLFTPQKI